MGASLEYKVKNGEPEMDIILEKNDYFPNEIIKGFILLKCGNLLKNGIINYNVFNEEYYSYKDNKNKQIEKLEFNKLISKSLKYSEIIDFSLLKGIKIPFLIRLPSDIFPNFEYCLIKFDGHIRNYLQIEIPEFNLFRKKLIVIKKPFNSLKSLLSFNVNKNINLLGILNYGYISFNASYKKNCYSFFDKIPIEICINNYSNNNIDITKIYIKLIRKITFKNKEDGENCEINDILYNNDMNIDKILDINNKNIKLNIEIAFEEPESLFNKYKIEFDKFNYSFIKDKSNLIKLIPNIDSNLIKCEYIIRIKLIYKSKLETDNICLEMPLSAFHEKIITKSENKENILNNNNIKQLNKNENGNIKVNKKINKINNINNENKVENIHCSNNEENNKEPNLYTNYGDDDWNTPKNGALIPKVE